MNVKKTCYVTTGVLLTLLITGGCNADKSYGTTMEPQQYDASSHKVRSFSSRKELDLSLENLRKSKSGVISDNDHLIAFNTSKVRGLSDNDSILLSDLVPDPDLRSLLTERGEIMINDTLYCITPYGTLFCHKRYATNLRNRCTTLVMDDHSDEQQLEDSLYVKDNVYRFDTFRGVSLTAAPNSVSNNRESAQTRSSSQPPMPDIDRFQRVNAKRHTAFGKFFQGAGIRNAQLRKFPNNHKMRINTAVYDYNYYFRKSCGVDIKVEHQTWLGAWNKNKEYGKNQIILGFKNVIVKYEYPKDYSEDIRRVIEANSKGQWHPNYGPGPKPYLPVPKWFKETALPLSEFEFLPISVKDISYGELYNMLMPKAYSFAQSILGNLDNQPKPIDPRPDFSDNPFSASTWMAMGLPVGVPVYAKDAAYLFIPYYYNTNMDGKSYLNYKFQDIVEIPFKISIQFDPYDATWRNALNGISAEFVEWNPTTDIQSGEFFAGAYTGSEWIGFDMSWQR